jgi:hypothetical protein
MEDSLVEQANKAAERLEKANAAAENIVKRQEALEARRIVGGQAEAGQKAPEVSFEEKKKQAMKEYFKGTAIEGAFK